jgi:hypothetical protein
LETNDGINIINVVYVRNLTFTLPLFPAFIVIYIEINIGTIIVKDTVKDFGKYFGRFSFYKNSLSGWEVAFFIKRKCL